MTKIGIIGAMELEVEQLKQEMAVTGVIRKAGMDFFEGTLNGADVVVVRCGIGKVNAALCVQILADVFQVSHVINTGVAGSLNARLDIGDILISKDALHHDMDVGIFGYQPGEVPQMGFREFVADQQMMALAKEACEKVNPDIHVMCGRVVSGDQFISSKEVKERLKTCERILHAGDFDKPEILRQLEEIRPVCAVRGNVDKGWAEHLPAEQEITLAGFRIYMIHNRKNISRELSGVDIVVCGHSHRYGEKREDGILYLIRKRIPHLIAVMEELIRMGLCSGEDEEPAEKVLVLKRSR
mgnify:CR=1 FL=1